MKMCSCCSLVKENICLLEVSTVISLCSLFLYLTVVQRESMLEMSAVSMMRSVQSSFSIICMFTNILSSGRPVSLPSSSQ